VKREAVTTLMSERSFGVNGFVGVRPSGKRAAW
jgi:hypothetical protein